MPHKELSFPVNWWMRIGDLTRNRTEHILPVFAPHGKFHEYKKKFAERHGLRFYSRHFLFPDYFFGEYDTEHLRYYDIMEIYKCKTRLDYARITFRRPELTLEEMCMIIFWYMRGENWFVQAGLAEEGTLGDFWCTLPQFLYEDPEEKMTMG